MKCVVCDDGVVDDQYGECAGCGGAFHLYPYPAVPDGLCGEERHDGDLCNTCLEKRSLWSRICNLDDKVMALPGHGRDCSCDTCEERMSLQTEIRRLETVHKAL